MNEWMNLREFDSSNFTLTQHALDRYMFPQAITHFIALYTGNQLTGSFVNSEDPDECCRM